MNRLVNFSWSWTSSSAQVHGSHVVNNEHQGVHGAAHMKRIMCIPTKCSKKGTFFKKRWGQSFYVKWMWVTELALISRKKYISTGKKHYEHICFNSLDFSCTHTIIYCTKNGIDGLRRSSFRRISLFSTSCWDDRHDMMHSKVYYMQLFAKIAKQHPTILACTAFLQKQNCYTIGYFCTDKKARLVLIRHDIRSSNKLYIWTLLLYNSSSHIIKEVMLRIIGTAIFFSNGSTGNFKGLILESLSRALQTWYGNHAL